MQMYDDDHPLTDDVSCRTNYAKDHHSTTAHTHTMAKGPSNKNFCHSTSFSIL